MTSQPWPAMLPVRQVRIARPTDRLDELVRFYRDGLGLPELDRFAGHAGYRGVLLGLPGTHHHLEFTQHDRGSPGPAPTRDNLLVLYFDDRARTERVAARLAALGHSPVEAENPYWTDNGAVTVEDPDRWRVVLMPQPLTGRPEPPVAIEWYDGDRDALRPMFELAEDSPAELDSYLHSGRVLVARAGPNIVGHLQLVDSDRSDQAEVKNMAVREDLRGQGLGRHLMRTALVRLAAEGVGTVRVATAAADTENLRFYQRQGFRLRSIERDAFTEAAGYPPGSQVAGIPLRDRVWLDLRLDPDPSGGRTT
ncbi:GNAT family N-acetyltransferase [Pseudonocardia hispaniensis]|uniref:GNAT family N-acetyltransferase n=1 Tax=Pseudonocardia hispaniensis TaxID=904933 RepID=A0ABW1J4D6_9PSEU